MKKLFLSIAVLFAMGVVLNSCGDDASGDADKKSACDCMKEAMESEGEKAPAGCEFMDKMEDKELMNALKDCPEMAGMFEMEMPEMDDMEMPEMPDMEDMPDMDEMMEDMPDMDEMMEDMPDMPDMK